MSDPQDETISFAPSDELTLAPSEVASIAVEVRPARRQSVNFELLASDSAFDGFLLESEARVREDGTAVVELQSPSRPSTFRVRASITDGPEAIRQILVVSQGYGTIRVTPQYEGVRDIAQWTASATLGVSCDELDSYWQDGAFVATGSSAATIADVHSGTRVAVVVRGGQLVSGCATIPQLDSDTTKELEVVVNDRPINVSEGILEVELGVESSTPQFAAHFEDAVALGSTYFYGEAQTEAEALLELMADQLGGSDSTDFQTSIEDYAVAAALDDSSSSGAPLTSTISSTLTAAANSVTGDEVFRGELSLEGDASQFLLTSAAGVPASVSGFSQGPTWMASAESGDTLVLGGSLTYEPLRWLVAIAELQAQGADDPQSRLVQAAACADVATNIFQATGQATHGTCETECLQNLCRAAVEPIWNGLRDAGNGLTSLHVGISGEASLYGPALVESLEGSWVGRVGDTMETSVRGPASGSAVVR